MRCRRNVTNIFGAGLVPFISHTDWGGGRSFIRTPLLKGGKGVRHTRRKAPRDNSIIMSAFVYFAHRLQCRRVCVPGRQIRIPAFRPFRLFWPFWREVAAAVQGQHGCGGRSGGQVLVHTSQCELLGNLPTSPVEAGEMVEVKTRHRVKNLK